MHHYSRSIVTCMLTISVIAHCQLNNKSFCLEDSQGKYMYIYQLKRYHAYLCDNIQHTYTSKEVGGNHWLSHSCKEDSSNEFSIT